MSIFARLSANTAHASFWPQWAAAWRGVQPSLSWAFKSEPAWIKTLKIRKGILKQKYYRKILIYALK